MRENKREKLGMFKNAFRVTKVSSLFSSDKVDEVNIYKC